jgi:hypothetical protein
MTASSLPATDVRHPPAVVGPIPSGPLVRLVRPWRHLTHAMAQACATGQLGPLPETAIGRLTGGRI